MTRYKFIPAKPENNLKGLPTGNLSQNLPEFLTDHIKSWVVHKEVNLPDAKKPQKVSYSAYDGKTFKGSLDDPENTMRFASFDEVLDELKAQKFGKWDGLGIMFTGNGLVGIDVDNCISNGKFSDAALEILNRFKGTYAEYSPSGKGFHIFVRGNLPKNFNNRSAGVEAYNRDRFFTVTGKPLNEIK